MGTPPGDRAPEPLNYGEGSRLGGSVPIALAILELTHPSWANGSVSQAVAAAGGWWIPLHALLLLGYTLLVALLWRATRSGLSRRALLVFAACNTAYLAIDGLGVGLLVGADPAAADQLWNARPVSLLADATGAAWAAALLATASLGRIRDRRLHLARALTWLLFVASASPLGAATALSRVAALGTGAWCVYAGGAGAIPVALLVFAAVLRQHVGPEAALGLVCVAPALVFRGATGRSAPAASFPP